MKLLSKETHVSIAVVNSHGDIVSWQYQPYFTLADLYPAKVKWLSNHTSLTRPGTLKGERYRNQRVFTGTIYLTLTEEEETAIQSGDTRLLDEPLAVQFADGTREVYILNSLWSSAVKSGTLTGYTADLNLALRKIFNYAESGVRVGRATRGGFSNGKVEDWPIQFLPMGELLALPLGFPLLVGDGEFFIRFSDAVTLRRGLVAKPFNMGQWRLSPQVLSQVKHPLDKEAVTYELLPHVAAALERINDHSAFVAHAFKFGMSPESQARLTHLTEEIADHPDLNLSLSPEKSRIIFDGVTTGSPKYVQGGIAIAGALEGCAVFPSKQGRFPKSELYLLGRYPVNNSQCLMPVVAIQEGPQADFLNEIEQFQGTLFGKMGEDQFMAAGQFIVIPDAYWPEAYAEARLIVCSDNVKACSAWQSAADVTAQKARQDKVSYTGYLSVCQWANKGNGIMVDPAVFKKSNGDFDFDQLEAMPETELPMLFGAFLKEWEVTEDLAISKLPKIYSFDGGEGTSHTKTLIDTLAGAMAVGLAANCNLVILNNDPRRWPEIAKAIDSDSYFYGMVTKGYIVEAYTAELIAWFKEICECDETESQRVIRLFYVLSFFIQCGVDGFKTNLANIGGMTELVRTIKAVAKTLRELELSQRIIQFNPKKSPAAFKDRLHQPIYAEGEQVFGVCEHLLKLAVEGFVWDNRLNRLELPDYLYLGKSPDAFKYWAIAPRTVEELESARLIRTMGREEIARRSMNTPQDWVLFNETYWLPLVRDFQQNGRVIIRYDRQVAAGKPVYTVVCERTFPNMAGISWERLANLLFFVFNDTGGKSTGSIIPLFWVPELREPLFELISSKPGQIERQDEFDLPVVGLDKAGIERGVSHRVKLRLERVKETVQLGQETLTAVSSRNYIELDDGRYVMFPKDGPVLGEARFTVTFRREGLRDIGHFERAIPVADAEGLGLFTLSMRLAALAG